mmetsp:Transcript_13756/g.27434  ORF Transcript_13756/g.27434 Transcript_13756/m.27434 type:complete len:228 (-) Transcript_13756:41-724(-)|eukprot:CAMPEP_0182462250 /NCGR_PEP_ID=MMETSP1319-20130603/6578_1 /TAXON_ID=172717 /ORGANISM="Bolidomonas pacifica, Strain RCC208" /LENGTH=227 /DNA_ID=CAMNT_0024661657 /DNA_START=382 /DNA_END=1065 /DNA_ORIENTATION=+
MKLSILGGSGGVGSKCVQYACRSSNITSIKVLCRSRAKLMRAVGESWDDSKAEIVEGDVTNVETVKAMCDGVDVVLSALGTTSGGPLVVEAAVRKVLNALAGTTTKFIFLTSIGIGDSLPQGKSMAPFFAYVIKPCFLAKQFQDLDDAEEVAFAQQDTPVVTIRPPQLTDTPPTEKMALKPASDLKPSKVAKISRADVARAMVMLCEDAELWNEWEGKGASVVQHFD